MAKIILVLRGSVRQQFAFTIATSSGGFVFVADRGACGANTRVRQGNARLFVLNFLKVRFRQKQRHADKIRTSLRKKRRIVVQNQGGVQ